MTTYNTLLEQSQLDRYLNQYKEKILNILMNEYKVSEKDAIRIYNNSTFIDVIRKRPKFALHYSAGYWAEDIYEEYLKLKKD